MRMLIPIAALAAAAPVAAQAPSYDPRADVEFGESLPDRREISEMGVTLDRMLGAFLRVDMGPILDATDPLRRNPDHGRRGRTLGALGGQDDPYFEQRLRASVRGATIGTGQAIEEMRVAAPAIRRSLEAMERSIGAAVRSVPLPPPSDYDEEPDLDGDRDWDDRD